MSTANPPAYEEGHAGMSELFAIPIPKKAEPTAPSPKGAVVKKPLVVELQLCLANGVTRPGYIRSGNLLKKTNDAITFTSTTTCQQLRDILLARADERGILPKWENGERQVMAMLVRPDGTATSSTRLDETSWEAGRELLLGRKRASLLFICAVVGEEYEEKELKREERRKKGGRCVVM